MPYPVSPDIPVSGDLFGFIYDVKDGRFGARGDGVADDTAAIQAAITVCAAAGGGVVFFPAGTYKISASLIITGDNIILRGAGAGSIIQPAAGANYDAISTPLPASAGLSGFVRNYIGVEALKIDGANMTGTTAGQGNLIHFYGARYSFIRDCTFINSKNLAILLDGDNTGPGFNFSYNNLIHHNVFDATNAGNFQMQNSEANDITNNQFKWCGSALTAAQPLFSSPDTVSMHCRVRSGYAYIAGNVFGNGGTYTTEAIRTENAGPCKIIGNRFDQVRNQAVALNGGNHEFIGNALTGVGSAATGVPGIQFGSNNNRVISNSFDTTAGAATWSYAVADSGGPFTGNVVADNLLLAGTVGVVNLNATSTTRVHHNAGYNPVGKLAAQPAVPASTTPITNNSGVDCEVYIVGGTITVISIGGQATGFTTTPATVRVPAGGTIAITYTVAPTWIWFGD